MTSLEVAAEKSKIAVEEAHLALLGFLNKFGQAKRGGIHDFIEVTLLKMIHSAVNDIDAYLSVGHKEVNATEVMHIVVDAYQAALDVIKRNLDNIPEVNFK